MTKHEVSFVFSDTFTVKFFCFAAFGFPKWIFLRYSVLSARSQMDVIFLL